MPHSKRHEINIYSNDDSENCAKEYGLEVLAKIPLDKRLSTLSDDGNIESYSDNYLKDYFDLYSTAKKAIKS